MNHYNKLIRDNFPDIFLRENKKVSYHTADSDQEYWELLLEGLQATMDAAVTKLDFDHFADMYEMLEAILDFKKVDKRELQAVKENKRIEFGGYAKRYVLDLSEENMGEDQKYPYTL